MPIPSITTQILEPVAVTEGRIKLGWYIASHICLLITEELCLGSSVSPGPRLRGLEGQDRSPQTLGIPTSLSQTYTPETCLGKEGKQELQHAYLQVGVQVADTPCAVHGEISLQGISLHTVVMHRGWTGTPGQRWSTPLTSHARRLGDRQGGHAGAPVPLLQAPAREWSTVALPEMAAVILGSGCSNQLPPGQLDWPRGDLPLVGDWLLGHVPHPPS